MNLKRAVGISLLVYITTFIIGWGSAVLLGVTDPSVEQVPTSLWVIGVVSAVVLGGLGAWWYFRSPKVTRSTKEGFLFGVILILTGFVLDVITISPTAFTGQNPVAIMLDYYSQAYFWITVILLIITATVIGALSAKQSPPAAAATGQQ